MKYAPRPYQNLARQHQLTHPRNALWARMGMGKTLSTLDSLATLYLCGETHPTLVVAPLRVARKTWPEEAARWDDFKWFDIVPIVGSENARITALRRDRPIYTTNYENLPWLVEFFGDRWPFRTVVADESTKVKSLRVSFRTSSKGNTFLFSNTDKGKRAQALARIAFKHVIRFWELTGSPSPRGLEDLWGQAWFLDGGRRLGLSFEAFKQRWFYPDRSGFGIIPHTFAAEQIQGALRDLCLSLDPRDWFDLREPVYNQVHIELPKKARKLYEDMEKRLFMELDNMPVEAFNAAAKTMKCLQIASGFAFTDTDASVWSEIHDAKIEALEDIMEEAAGMPVICCYFFRPDLERLQKAFPKGVNLATDAGLETFKRGEAPIGFAHPSSVGHGIDGLQRVSNIIAFFGHWWDTETREQVIERIGPVRQMQSGLERDVFIYDIIAEGTIDQDVVARHFSKIRVQDALLKAMRDRGGRQSRFAA